jgi:Domain of unknown function (DUF6379)
MFDKYMICESDVRNLKSGSQVTGFEFGARLPYYRGIGLSMVERIGVSLDGTEMDGGRIRLRLRDRTYTLPQMETVYDEAWNMGEVAHVQVELPGGLTPGPHKLELTEQLRISYLPFPLIGKDSKTVEAGG